jgi:thymidylate synthase (FAD)
MLEQIEVKLIGSYGNDALICYQASLSSGVATKDIDALVAKLYKRKHMKPFEVVDFHFEIKVPIFVDRQLETYRSRRASVANSGRYGSAPLEFYRPAEMPLHLYEPWLRSALHAHSMIEKECELNCTSTRRREVARCTLPQGQLVRRSFKIDLRNLFHFLDERLAPHAQVEVQDLAQKMLKLAAPVCPTAFKCWAEGSNFIGG